MFTNSPVRYDGIRFSLSTKDSLVAWINSINHREFSSNDFTFDVPVSDGLDGWVLITGKYLPSDERISLRVQRVDLTNIPGLEVFILHTKNFTKEGIAEAIFEQYGIRLELDLFELDMIKEDIQNVLGPYLYGFGEGEIDAIDVDSVYGDAEGSITISENHLTLTGKIFFKVRAAMLPFDKQIDSVLALRKYYTMSDELKPFVDTLQPKGVWTVDKAHFGTMEVKKEVDARLFEMTLVNDGIVDYSFLAHVLTSITGQVWTSDNSQTPFNVMGSIIKYNGVTGKYPNVAPVAYSYLMILELSDYCSNLQGNIHIAYQYANYKHPLYGNKTLAGIPPL